MSTAATAEFLAALAILPTLSLFFTFKSKL